MKTTLPNEVTEIMRFLRNRAYRPLLTGGAVRDILLGREVNDYDIEVFGEHNPNVLLAHLQKGFPRTKEVGISFGVFDVSHYPYKIQVSLPRLERKTGSAHTDYEVEFTDDLHLAAERRDLTINAIYMDELGGFFDPMNGVTDLKQKQLHPCSPRFAEDALRVLRVFQLSSRLNMVPTDMTVRLSEAMLDELALVSRDRIAEEWWKWATKAETPSIGILYLEKCGALARFYPELAAMRFTQQDSGWHPEGDCLRHTCLVLDSLAGLTYNSPTDRAVMLLAGLLHDVGKPGTSEVSAETGRIIAPGHAEVSTGISRAFLEYIRAPEDVKVRVLKLVENHMARLDKREEAGIRRLAVALHPVNIREHLLLNFGDRRGQLLPEELAWGEFDTQLNRAIDAQAAFSKPEPLLMGRHLLELNWMKPGPEMGKLLKEVYEAQLEGTVVTLEQALLMAESLLKPVDL